MLLFNVVTSRLNQAQTRHIPFCYHTELVLQTIFLPRTYHSILHQQSSLDCGLATSACLVLSISFSLDLQVTIWQKRPVFVDTHQECNTESYHS
jgi:hypothetical protein